MDETANPDAVSFVESGLTFGPFPSTRTWRIEQSQLYCKQAPKGLRVVEAVLWRPGQKGAPPRLIFLEAKSSAPTTPPPQSRRSGFASSTRRFVRNSSAHFISGCPQRMGVGGPQTSLQTCDSTCWTSLDSAWSSVSSFAAFRMRKQQSSSQRG
jgi:hypothetical protein